MLWINFGLICVGIALVITLACQAWPAAWPLAKPIVVFALQMAGVLVVTWFLVLRGEALGAALPPPPEDLNSLWPRLVAPAAASLEILIIGAALGTLAGTVVATLLVWAQRQWLDWTAGLVSLVWIVPTFLLAILLQDLQSVIYNLSGVNVAAGYGLVTPTQVAWCAVLLSIRPAASSFRQNQVLMRDQSRAGHVRTALAKGLPWSVVVRRHIVRPAAAGLVSTAAASMRVMIGSLPLVEYIFAYPGLGRTLLLSLGVVYGQGAPRLDPSLAIGAAVLLAATLAIVEAAKSIAEVRLDPRLIEAA
jgi:ABC-type dipeptide/oligopeptide/nickel transport system permease component